MFQRQEFHINTNFPFTQQYGWPEMTAYEEKLPQKLLEVLQKHSSLRQCRHEVYPSSFLPQSVAKNKCQLITLKNRNDRTDI